MDFSQIALNQGLTFLAWVTGIVILAVGGFLIKLLIDLSALSKNLNETSILINTELKPTLQEINETLHAVNTLVKSTDRNVDSFKSAVEKTFGKTKMISESIVSGVIKGFVTVMGLFTRK
ncbi:hypothetical protein KID03_04330 [bacterium]|uniref:DUF948 domain-containing protein n=1 Tax=Candidatus Scatenecus faecavium TaxID=2840915 RepID=A0A9D1FUJ9_9BACT|nr:hypothetical protein [bacterium]PWL76783.1 MAG: hypothetical protein DBY21_06645 [Candidatus Gastranaerophilales bacterium]HIS82280.1 hypothetical protein [Candidatus Scatenecus faecavium]